MLERSEFNRIDVLAIVMGLVVAGLFAAFSGLSHGASALAGCALGVLNFAALRFILSRLLRSMESGEGAGRAAGLFGLKLLGLMGIIYGLAQVAERLDGLAFAAGFVTILVSVTVMGLMVRGGSTAGSAGKRSANHSSSGEKAIQS